MIFVCDKKRHLVCLPYSIENLHKMAIILNIKPIWFHKTEGLEHYDIPLKRIEEIMERCVLVSSKDIVKIIKGEITHI